VTNLIFIFETSPNAKPKEKKVGRYWRFLSPLLKKLEDTSPVSPTKLRLWVHINYKCVKEALLRRTCHALQSTSPPPYHQSTVFVNC